MTIITGGVSLNINLMKSETLMKYLKSLWPHSNGYSESWGQPSADHAINFKHDYRRIEVLSCNLINRWNFMRFTRMC